MALRLHELDVNHPALVRHPEPMRQLVDRLLHVDGPRCRTLWNYYTNSRNTAAITTNADRPYRQAQEFGMPARVTGEIAGDEPHSAQAGSVDRKEVVIENDIGWRIDAAVDFLFGKPIVLDSTANGDQRRVTIARLLRLIVAQNGGVQFLQRLALTGAIYGTADVLVQFDPARAEAATVQPPPDSTICGLPEVGGISDETPDEELARIASTIRLRIIEPHTALPLLEPDDCDCVRGYGIVQQLSPTGDPRDVPTTGRLPLLRRLLDALNQRPTRIEHTDAPLRLDIHTAHAWQRYENERLLAEGENPLGRLPIVHLQNIAVPGRYHGGSDVDELLPLQDELNTRLSDRASRLALQSFKMYVGIGIDGFADNPVGPGQMWETTNTDARVLEFGGDADSPSEDAHIAEVREALDKTSGISPIAAGAIKGRVGRLTSAAALRVTLLAALGRTERKRLVYGAALGRMCELALAWLDHGGLFATDPAERGVRNHWPSPLPADDADRLDIAKDKLAVGIDADIVRRELGY
ncbi:MAG: hypothetical protein AAF656_01360 [Planctomycetota bacterium]